MALRLMDVVEMVPALVDRLVLSARMLCLIQTCKRLRDLMSSEMLDGVSQARARSVLMRVKPPAPHRGEQKPGKASARTRGMCSCYARAALRACGRSARGKYSCG